MIVTYVPGDKSELKPGAKIFIGAANKKDDGTLEAVRRLGRPGWHHAADVSGLCACACRRRRRHTPLQRGRNMSAMTRRDARGRGGLRSSGRNVGLGATAANRRVRGTIEKVDGKTLLVKGRDGAPLTLTLADNVQVVSVVKASLADIKEGAFIGSGAMPQADGSQKALEVHIFARISARNRRGTSALGWRSQQHHDQWHRGHGRHRRRRSHDHREIPGR